MYVRCFFYVVLVILNFNGAFFLFAILKNVHILVFLPWFVLVDIFIQRSKDLIQTSTEIRSIMRSCSFNLMVLLFKSSCFHSPKLIVHCIPFMALSNRPVFILYFERSNSILLKHVSMVRDIFTSQCIVISYRYTIPWQKSLSKNVLDIRLSLSANQSDWSFESEFSGYTIFTFHFNEEHGYFTQWEIVCDWFHMMPVEPINWKPNF